MIKPLAPASGGGGCGMEGLQVMQSFQIKVSLCMYTETQVLCTMILTLCFPQMSRMILTALKY